MESEKMMYWTTLGVLVLATVTGFVTEHRGWGDPLVDRSIAMLSQAAAAATNYATVAGLALGRDENDLALSPRDVARVQAKVQTRVACVQRILVRHQAEMNRLQAVRFRVRALQSTPRIIELRNQNMVIEVPRVAEEPED
jgi:hypothetical protein